MREITQTVFTIDELSDSAKDKAYYKWLESTPYGWTNDNEETLNEFADIFNISINHWEYDACGHHVRFEFNDEHEFCDISELSGQRLATYIYNNFYDSIVKGKYYSTQGKWIDGKYHYNFRYSKVIIHKDCCPLTGYYMDDVILEPIFKFLDKPSKHTTFEDLMRKCLDSWGKACSNDFRDSTSMKYFIEESKENNWEYYESGIQYY